MNTQERSVMQLALDALRETPGTYWALVKRTKAIDDLEKALAQPQESDVEHYRAIKKRNAEVVALETAQQREALAQPRGSPYGKCPVCGANGVTRERGTDGYDTCVNGHSYKSSLSVKSQPQGEWVDLTDDEIAEALNCSLGYGLRHGLFEDPRSVIAAFKEKNTPKLRGENNA